MSRGIGVLSIIPSLSNHIRALKPNSPVNDILPGRNDTLEKLNNADILVADCDLLIPYLYDLTSIKWVQSTWAGVDKLNHHIREKKLNFQLTRFSDDSFGLSMTEYVIAHIFNHERDQKKQYKNQENSLWERSDKMMNYRLVRDLSVGILGLGNIGKCIARGLKILGAKVWGVSRTMPEQSLEYVDEHRTIENLIDVLKNCNYIVNVLPSTPDTDDLLGGDVLKSCQKNTVFINIGRGNIIDEIDLIRAIKNQWISAAILDVLKEEPLPKTSKLWTLHQVTISPHISGVSRPQDIANFFMSNYDKYVNGEKLIHVYDPEKNY